MARQSAAVCDRSDYTALKLCSITSKFFSEEDCMAKKNNDFFVEKKAWSVVKDELLGCYFYRMFPKFFTHIDRLYM